MIEREIKSEFLKQLGEFPIVTVLGPRQAGKTTLVKAVLPKYGYVNLEDPQVRAVAEEDPQAFLKQLGFKVIFDEIQRAPHLLSYIQVLVDKHDEPGQFVLTGSHQPQLKEAITQTLAGRTGILQLLPLTSVN
jgi:predicted AAA+ superfamily ATPase